MHVTDTPNTCRMKLAKRQLSVFDLDNDAFVLVSSALVCEHRVSKMPKAMAVVASGAIRNSKAQKAGTGPSPI